MYVFRGEHKQRLSLPAEADPQAVEAVDHITQAVVLSGTEDPAEKKHPIGTEAESGEHSGKGIPTYMRVPLKGLNEKKIRISEYIRETEWIVNLQKERLTNDVR